MYKPDISVNDDWIIAENVTRTSCPIPGKSALNSDIACAKTQKGFPFGLEKWVNHTKYWKFQTSRIKFSVNKTKPKNIGKWKKILKKSGS